MEIRDTHPYHLSLSGWDLSNLKREAEKTSPALGKGNYLVAVTFTLC